MEKEILRVINREIIKSAKKGESYYYWDISDVDKRTIDKVSTILESEGKMVRSKGTKYKLITW